MRKSNELSSVTYTPKGILKLSKLPRQDNRYYRIVYFDKKGYANGIEIKSWDETNVEELISRHPYPQMEIYRCNAKGNNYDGRRIYPPRY